MAPPVSFSIPTPDPPDDLDLPDPSDPSTPPALFSYIPQAVPSLEAPSYAERFKASLRNLTKIDSPTTLIDGIPVVQAPESILLKTSETWKDHILAKFHGTHPHPGKIFQDLNPIWGKQGNITIRSISPTACLIFVPAQEIREWVFQVGYWQVDNCGLSAFLWTPDISFEDLELRTAPTWAVLKCVPPQLYSLPGISVIASAIGEPLHTEKSRLDPFNLEIQK